MSYKFAAFISLVMSIALLWVVSNAQIDGLPAAISGQAGVIFFLLGIWFFIRSIQFTNTTSQLLSEGMEKDAKEVAVTERAMSMKAVNRLTRVLLMLALGLLITSLYGCGGRLQYVEFGIDRMAPADKERLSQVLTDNPDGRRSSWYNRASNSQYTITPVRTYWAAGGQDANGNPKQRLCREYLIDDVYPYNAHPNNRGHMQLTEYACFNEHTLRWVAINGHWERPWIKFGGPNYYNWRNR